LCKAPESRFEAFNMDEIVVRSFGNAAVVTGRTLVTTRGVTPQTVRLRFTDVFVRRSGRWLIVASQGTLLQP
jgi:ketosteroid isomerase-like protein